MNLDLIWIYMSVFVFNVISSVVSYRKTNHKVYVFNILFWVGILLNLIGQSRTEPHIFGITIGVYVLCNYSMVKLWDYQLNQETNFKNLKWVLGGLLGLALILQKTTDNFMLYSFPMIILTIAPFWYFGISNFKKLWQKYDKLGKVFLIMIALVTIHILDFPFLRLNPLSNVGFLISFIFIFLISFMLNRVTNEVYLNYQESKIKELNDEKHQLIQNQVMNSMMTGFSHEMNTALQVIKSSLEILEIENQNPKILKMMNNSLNKIESIQSVFKEKKSESFSAEIKMPSLISDVEDFLQVKNKIFCRDAHRLSLFSNKLILTNVLINVLKSLLLKNDKVEIGISRKTGLDSIEIIFDNYVNLKEVNYQDFLVSNSLISQLNGSIHVGKNSVVINLFKKSIKASV